jgi:hypothetical protein
LGFLKIRLCIGLWWLTTLSTIFQLYRSGNQSQRVPGENQQHTTSYRQTLFDEIFCIVKNLFGSAMNDATANQTYFMWMV